MKKLLWTGEAYTPAEAEFMKEYDIEKYGYAITGKNDDALSDKDGDQLIALLKEKEIFVIGYDVLSAHVLGFCGDLKCILSVRDGPEENIDIDTCTKLGIPVLSAGGRCAHGVAELTLMSMYLLARRYLPLQRYMEEGGWTKNGYDKVDEVAAESEELGGKTLGIVGLGRNGRELAKLALGVGMKVIAYDPYVNKAMVSPEIQIVDDLMELMPNIDYFSILARVSETNKKMIGRKEIFAMKPTASFINTGRAALVDMDALYDALEQNVIRAAALDVYTEEPPSLNSRVYSFPTDKLIITPHIGGTTKERIPHQYEALIEGLRQLTNGEIPHNLINKEVLQQSNFRMKK